MFAPSNSLADVLESCVRELRAAEADADRAPLYTDAVTQSVGTLAGVALAAAAAFRSGHREPSTEQLGTALASATAAYADGHRAGWIAALAAYGHLPDDPDDPETYAGAAAISAPPQGATVPTVADELGRLAYNTHAERMALQRPDWDNAPHAIRAAWIHAAWAVHLWTKDHP